MLKIFLVLTCVIVFNSEKNSSGNISYFKKSPCISTDVRTINKKDSLRFYSGTLFKTKNELIDSLIKLGKTFVGKKYRYKGPSPWPMDCAGYVAFLFSRFGYTLSHSAPGQALTGKKVPLDSLQKGDLMFFKGRNSKSKNVGHVALFLKSSNDTIYFIHSSSMGIRVDYYPQSYYYKKRFLFCKRLDL